MPAQILPVGDALEDYARLLQLTGALPPASFTTRPTDVQEVLGDVEAAAPNPWARYVARAASGGISVGPMQFGGFDPELRGVLNTDRPWGTNADGVWYGRGETISVTAGGFFRAGPLTVTARPILSYSANRDFELWDEFVRPDLSRFSYPMIGDDATIDLPQRFGDAAFTRFDPGQSSIRVDYYGAAAGISTENMWWGPGRSNAITMTNNAPGFPHAFVGTSRPIDVHVGAFQGRWVWGRLDESRYFDASPENDRRFFTGIVVDFEPAAVPGLFLGATRAIVQSMPDGRWPAFGDHFAVLRSPFRSLQEDASTSSRLAATGVGSLFARWVMPASGLEVYGEYGRGDSPRGIRDFAESPEYASGYVLGMQKAFVLTPEYLLRVNLEHTSLGRTRSAEYRDTERNFFYMDDLVSQGYTHRGRVIGAGIGTGSMEHLFAADVFSTWGRAGVFASRIAYDYDRYVRWAEPTRNHYSAEVELNLGVNGTVFYQGLEFHGGLGFNHLLNRRYVFDNDHTNLNMVVGLRYNLMGLR